MKPSKYQEIIYKVFQQTNKDINISAVAGSGKTTVLLKLLKFVPDGDSSLFLAFNNSIIDELRGRNKRRDVEIMTIHSCGWRSILSRYGGKVKMNPNKGIAKTEKVLKEFKTPDKRRGYFFYVVPKILGLMRCNLCENNAESITELINHYDIDVEEDDIKLVMKAFEYLIKDKSQFDFMDMIYVPVTDPSIRFKKYDYVFCDESQDFSICQHQFIKNCLNRKGRLVTVGDKRQCQPFGTKIVLAGGNVKDISEVKIGDQVVSYDKNGGGFIGYAKNHTSLHYAKKIEDVQKRNYDGKLICVNTKDNLSKYTPNHRCIVKFDEKLYYKGYFVYLMNRITEHGVDWRIGKTKIYDNHMVYSKFYHFYLTIKLCKHK